MGQKVRPIGFRTGIMTDWRSRWFAEKQEFSELLLEDAKIRSYIKKKLPRSGISRVEIERTREQVTLLIYSARVGLIIGKKGAEIDKLTQEIEKITKRRIEIKTIEITTPEVDAQLVAEDICDQLEKRASFRRTMKRAMELAMDNGAKGIKLQLSGRLGGAEMARCEKAAQGSVPLSTLRAKIDYGFAEAATPQGNIGVKVWINNGDYLTPEESNGDDAQARQVPKKPARSRAR